MTYPIEYMFQMSQRHWQNKCHGIKNVTLIVANVTQIKSGIMINVGAGVKI